MLVIINGAFGVGKTTVVAILRRRFPGSTVFDPERIGYVLQRLPTFVPFSARRLDDYQDSAFWRFITAYWAGRQARRGGVVFLPMCFSNPAYLRKFGQLCSREAAWSTTCADGVGRDHPVPAKWERTGSELRRRSLGLSSSAPSLCVASRAAVRDPNPDR
jgi:hypothetical protein